VLDFGLAKAWATEGDTDLSLSPTLTRHATAEGIILGTAAYMSPEQARGKRVDRRADIWAFGVVLWEMLTGQRLFDGETVTDVLAAVLTVTPDVAALPEGVGLQLRALLERCLTRDPRLRLRDVGEARIVLDGCARGEELAEAPATPRHRRSGVGLAGWAAAAVLAPSRDGRGGSWNDDGTIIYTPYSTGPIFRVAASGGPTTPLTGNVEGVGSGTHRFPQFLPDGEHFLFLDRPAVFGESLHATVRIGQLESGESLPLLEVASNAVYSQGHLLYARDGALVAQAFGRGTEARLARAGADESDPVFSADGETLYYSTSDASNWRLVRRTLATGEETPLRNQDDGHVVVPMTVSPDGRWLVCDDREPSTVADMLLWPLGDGNGDESRALLASDADEGFAQISPDGRWLAWASDQSGRYKIYVAPFPQGGSSIIREARPRSLVAEMVSGTYGIAALSEKSAASTENPSNTLLIRYVGRRCWRSSVRGFSGERDVKITLNPRKSHQLIARAQHAFNSVILASWREPCGVSPRDS
jgi:hypothetical protein